MRARGWRIRTVRALIRLDRDLNRLCYAVLMPPGPDGKITRLGSGLDETFCAHWHHLAGNGVWWADLFCRGLDAIDCDHCKKSAEEYRGKGLWLTGK